MPTDYWQGVTSDPGGNFYFDGVYSGLYRTNASLQETARNSHAIPPEVKRSEGYNHLGDISWDAAEGGRLLLPLACFYPRPGFDGNTCRTAAIGVADPATLRWRYYVKLDPADVITMVWAEASPDGKLLWTVSGNDLIAYAMGDLTPANAAPAGPLIRPVVRLRGAKPSGGTTGASFYKGRLLLAAKAARKGTVQLWSIDVGNGARRLEFERPIVGESEGIDVAHASGSLEWEIMPHTPPGQIPTYGTGHGALMHLAPLSGQPDACSYVKSGGAGNESLRGTTSGDKISGRAGADRLFGLAGDDCLFGGPGNDILSGGPGADKLLAGDGRDVLRGGRGADSMFGGAGDDTLAGESGNDVLVGGEGRDTLSGGRGRDTLVSGPGADRLDGGPGDDKLIAGPGADRLRGGSGNDVLKGGAGNDRLSGGPGRDKLSGGPGDDVIDAADGERDVVNCGPGKDKVRADSFDKLIGCRS